MGSRDAALCCLLLKQRYIFYFIFASILRCLFICCIFEYRKQTTIYSLILLTMSNKQETRINVFRAQSHRANNQWQSCDEYLLHLIRMKNKDLKNRITNLQNLLYNEPAKEN